MIPARAAALASLIDEPILERVEAAVDTMSGSKVRVVITPPCSTGARAPSDDQALPSEHGKPSPCSRTTCRHLRPSAVNSNGSSAGWARNRSIARTSCLPTSRQTIRRRRRPSDANSPCVENTILLEESEVFSMTVPVTGRQLDAEILGRWLDTHSAPRSGELPVLEQLKGGSQNTLYLIERGDQRMVLRMPGPRADAARIDGLLREIRLVRALSGTDVPHAELIAADETGSVLGMPFYVMRAIDGWSPMDGGWQPPFDTDLQARRGLAFQLVDGAARLGRVDWRAQRPRGLRPSGRIPRTAGRSLAEVSRRLQGARTSRPGRGGRLAAR